MAIGKTRGPCPFCSAVDDVCACRATRHVHCCPSCFASPPCPYDDCSIEPTLTLDDGTRCGAHELCDDCAAGLLPYDTAHLLRCELVTAFVDVEDGPPRALSRGPRPDPISLGRIGDALARGYALVSSWLLNTHRT